MVGTLDGNTSPIVWNLFFLQRSGGLGERILPLLQSYGKEEKGFWGRDSSLPQTVVPVRNSVCQFPHDPIGGGVRRILKQGEGAKRSYFLLPTFLW